MTGTLTLKQKKGKNSQHNPLQNTFNRLTQKIETLQKECHDCTKTLDRHLDFYHQVLLPKLKESSGFFKSEIKMIYPYFKDKKNHSKKERGVLKQAISSLFEKVAFLEDSDMILDEELSKIFQDIVGFSYEDHMLNVLEDLKKSTEKQFLKEGIDLDLSQLKVEGSREEFMQKLLESMRQQGAFFEKKEKQVRETEALPKKEISTIYKQLAKTFHPDLEIDPALKLEKEVLMKQLTAAYEEKDLHTLLTLELKSSSPSQERTEEQLKAYNHLLQNQVITLQDTLHKLPTDYKYNPLQNFSQYYWKKGDFVLRQMEHELDRDLQNHKQISKLSKTGNTLQAIRDVMKSFLVFNH